MALAIPFIVFGFVMKEPGIVAWLPLAAFAMARTVETLQHDLSYRAVLLVCSSLWIIYGAILGLPQIVLLEIMGVISNAFGIWRFYGRRARPAVF